MSEGGKHRRRRLSEIEHRERADRYRKHANSNIDPNTQQELIVLAIKHEAIADELALRERLKAVLNASPSLASAS